VECRGGAEDERGGRERAKIEGGTGTKRKRNAGKVVCMLSSSFYIFKQINKYIIADYFMKTKSLICSFLFYREVEHSQRNDALRLREIQKNKRTKNIKK
jgi:hypothetical protein